jgi:RNA polymerase sigma-70 factor (ECF subfamily)
MERKRGSRSGTVVRSDAELAAACGRGEEDAFIELERRHREMILRVAYRFLRDRSEALDVAQEVLLAAYRELGDWKPEARLSTWLYRVTANIAIEHARHRTRRQDLEDGLVAQPVPSEGGDSVDDDLLERTFRAIADLPDRQRKVVTLRFIEELPLDEISEALGISRNNAKVALGRGMRRLRDVLVT